ncbi:MAG: ExeA family protein [Terriglobales bacterium]
MYKAHFGLRKNPFELSPDPYFFYPSARHNEALANIYYGVRKRKGFVVVTGEVGTGKTLLVRCLIDILSKNQIAFAYVFNTRLTDLEFLRYIAGDLSISPVAASKSDVLLQLNDFLIARHRLGQTTVLIVDEAQDLEWEVLEEIRLLTNLETAQEKLLQIVLIGQPELEYKLDTHNLRQLKQRIAFRSRLDPLDEKQAEEYIVRRLQLAGATANAQTIFPAPAISAIYRYSKGIPRLINTLCENAMISAYARQASAVTVEMVDEVAEDFRLDIIAEPSAPTNGTQSRAVLKRLLEVLQGTETTEQPKL